jgi:polyhydroxyalkanoate synthase subunit PhaC
MTAPATQHDDELVDAALGGELLATLDPMLLATSLVRTVTPGALFRAFGRVVGQMPAVLSGDGPIEISPKDSRFRDEAWTRNPVYRAWAQAYLVLERELMATVENQKVDWRTRERSRLVMGVVTSAMAPTNNLIGNPDALKQAFTTGGRSLVDGAKNFAKDLVNNRGLPSQVDTTAFVVGTDIATTPGWVVHRTDMFELIHYTPTTEVVGTTPLVLLPPPVNKFYFWDLAPGRSLIEYAVSRGVDVFTIVWRDPKPGNGVWGIDAYLASALAAIDVARDIADTPSAHVFGDCSGGMFLTMLLGHQSATGALTIETGTLGVTVVDFGEPGGIGVTASTTGRTGLRRRADRGEIISANSIGDTFVWMRPNDLVWRYVVDEWLLGRKPPAFDIMFWNADGQGLPSQLALEMTQMSLDNGLMEPGGITVLGERIDLRKVKVDTYQIAGKTDHISPWKACYAAAAVLGGANEFILTPTGHVQSIIYPPDNPRAAYFTNRDTTDDADVWLENATRHSGSWWPHWVDWLLERSSGTRTATTEPGNGRHPAIATAPGTYVLGQ